MVMDSFQISSTDEGAPPSRRVWATNGDREIVVYHWLNDQALIFMRGRDSRFRD